MKFIHLFSDDKDHLNSKWALRITKLLLLFFLAGICVVGKRKSTWPIITWSLYSTYRERFHYPRSTTSIRQLKVVTNNGEVYIFTSSNLISQPRDGLSSRLIDNAFDHTDMKNRDATRDYLTIIIHNHLPEGSSIDYIEGEELYWQTSPLESPPIQRNSPSKKKTLGKF